MPWKHSIGDFRGAVGRLVGRGGEGRGVVIDCWGVGEGNSGGGGEKVMDEEEGEEEKLM